MSTIGSLLALMDPNIKPYSEGMESVNRAQRGQTLNQTELIQLAELKRAQEARAQELAFYQQHPEMIVGGGSIIGSLGAGPGMPPGGPLTQTTTMPGQPPTTQQVPGGQDLSRFSGVSPAGGGPIPTDVMQQVMPQSIPQQSILANLAPQQQRNPLMDLVRNNPQAGLAVQQQMQQSQDRQWKIQEQQLGMGVKVAEFVARELQGVTDQASLDQARERIRQVHPQAAAQVPQMYSQEAVAGVQQRGIAVKDRAESLYHEAKARNLDMETRMFPELAQRFGLGGDGQAPADGGASATTGAPGTGTAARTAPPEFESAITEANRLYPQVSTTRIKSIIAAESNFDAKAVSSAGAQGPMQLLPGTAKDMGVDDPFNVQQNVRGGTRYYAQMLTKYGGDERKALAAYNWGPGNLDKVNGDVSKAPPETQAYVNRVLGGGGSGPGGTAQAPAIDPRITQLDAKIAQRTREAQIASLMKNESLSTRLNDDANRLTAEKNRLIDESRRQQERGEEIPRDVQKQQALMEGELKKQRAAAEVSLEAKMNEPIGPENALNMNLPPQTRWKDVPKDVKITKPLGDTPAKQFSEFKASHAGLSRVLTMLENPKAHSIIGTLFSGDNAAFRRRAGEWISSVTPQERKFVASLVAEIADIRHTLSGAAVTPPEAEFLQPMMPSAADPDVGTVRAKLEALQEWMTRKHDAYRDQFEQSGYRVPAALARIEEKAPPTGSGNVDKFKAIKP